MVADVCGSHGGKSLGLGWRERLDANVPPADSTVKSDSRSLRWDYTNICRGDAVFATSLAMYSANIRITMSILSLIVFYRQQETCEPCR